jgi:hypothetical protein
MADGELAGADPASNYGGSHVWLFANLMYRLNRILDELHLPSRSAVMLASRPAMIARRRSGHPPHYCREGSGRAGADPASNFGGSQITLARDNGCSQTRVIFYVVLYAGS